MGITFYPSHQSCLYIYLLQFILFPLDGDYTSNSIFSSCVLYKLLVAPTVIFYYSDPVISYTKISVSACYNFYHCIQLFNFQYSNYSIMLIAYNFSDIFLFSHGFYSTSFSPTCLVPFKYRRILCTTPSHDVGSGPQHRDLI